MAQNEGKKFEQDIIKSIPEGVFYYRLRDSAGTWQGGDNTRFTPSNICDLIVFNEGNLYLLELKSHKGKSIPLTCIRENQIEGLMKAYKKGIKAGYIINFRDIEETYYFSANSMNSFLNTEERKSIPLQRVREYGILIPQEKKRVRYKYDLNVLLNS